MGPVHAAPNDRCSRDSAAIDDGTPDALSPGMSTTTLILIILLALLVFGGGGLYLRR